MVNEDPPVGFQEILSLGAGLAEKGACRGRGRQGESPRMPVVLVHNAAHPCKGQPGGCSLLLMAGMKQKERLSFQRPFQTAVRALGHGNRTVPALWMVLGPQTSLL